MSRPHFTSLYSGDEQKTITMRKSQTLLAVSVCVPSIANTQTRHPFEDSLQQEMSMLLGNNPITLFLDWLAAPVVQNILLFLTVMSILYCITLIILHTLMIREALPSDWTDLLKNWISIDKPVGVVNRKYPTPFELEQRRLQHTNVLMELGQPILATVNFLDKTKEETEGLRQQLIGRKIEIVLSNDGSVISIE